MMRPPSLVVLNPAARGGRAPKLWKRVEREVESHSRPEVVHIDRDGAWLGAVEQARASGVRLFLAAGGDGTVNALANALLDSDERVPDSGRSELPLTLGAVGLGSSNDFHKPLGHQIGGVPMRVNPRMARARDVGTVRYRGLNGVEHRRRFLVSASMGLTAEANACFNGADLLLRGVKRRSTLAAIAYAALRTASRFRSFPARLRFHGEECPRPSLQLTNLSVMKTPYLSGWLRYDTPVEPDDGRFVVNLCHGLSAREIALTLADLSRGSFLASGRRGCHSFRTAELGVELDQPVALELDGEVVRATDVTFELSPRRLRCCA